MQNGFQIPKLETFSMEKMDPEECRKDIEFGAFHVDQESKASLMCTKLGTGMPCEVSVGSRHSDASRGGDGFRGLKRRLMATVVAG